MARRNNDNQPIKSVLEAFVEKNKLQAGLNSVNVSDAWMQLMGNGVVNYTESVALNNSTLYVKLTSSVLREELSYGKDKIITMLNEAIGKPLITTLVLK